MTLLWLPTLDTLFQIDRTPPRSEHRAMAACPSFPFHLHGLRDYFFRLDAYFNDHFGFRNCLIKWNNELKEVAFHESSPHVLVGKDGWLFLTDNRMIGHYSGQFLFTQEELHEWQLLLEKRRDWLARRGISYLFVVAPDKHSIYPEELPDWLVKVHSQTKLDQFFAYMHEHSTVALVDLREVIRNSNEIHPTYLKTDTHWNFFGSFVTYQELIRTLAKQSPGLEPMPLSSFTVINERQPGGDLDRFLGSSMTETNAYDFIPKPGIPSFSEKLALDENAGPKLTTNPKVQGRLIVFQDSFGRRWIPFMGYNFNKVTYLWQYNLNPAWIEQDKPNIVVNEMVERFFNTENPKLLMVRESLN